MTRAIEHKTLDWLWRHGLISDGDTVLIALSGGADSVCLARVLLALGERLHIRLAAAHYNHQLRGEASGRDEAFVRQFCSAFDLPLTVGSGDVAGAVRQSGCGMEETAREMRYAFLTATAQTMGADKIATGHNADDNVETVLLHLIRGAGLRGLAGIPPSRGQIVRPILALERREVEAYLAELGQGFVEDATNCDTALRRNALRHQVLPILKGLNPNLAEGVLRQSELLRQDSRFLDEVAEEAFGEQNSPPEEGNGAVCLPIKNLTALAPAIASRVVALAIRAAGGEADAVHVRQVLDIAASGDPSAETKVRGDITVRREYDQLIFGPFYKNPETFHAFHFKSAAVCGRITVRPRETGDKIRLPGRGGTKTVKKLMIEEKIPARERERLPILADEAGVIAVYGIGIDERVTPGPGDEILTVVVEGKTCTEM